MSVSYVHVWFGGHSGGAIPGLVSIPEVKSSCVLFVVLWMRVYGKLIALPAIYVYLSIRVLFRHRVFINI